MSDKDGDLFGRRPPGRLFCCRLLLSLLLCLVSSVGSFGQEEDELSVGVVFGSPYVGTADSLLRCVKEQTGLTLAYSSRLYSPRAEVRLPKREVSVRECLDAVFWRFPVEYVVSRGKVVVSSSGRRYATLSGYCRDSSSGDVLIGAHVVDTLMGVGAATNEFGYFSVRLLVGRVPLRSSFVGYGVRNELLELKGDTLVDIGLTSRMLLSQVDVVGADTVEVEYDGEGVVDLPMEQVNALPTLLGEADIIRAVQLMPGIQVGNGGMGGMSVRGGGSDQNMVYYDDAPLFNANHMLGLYSVFNSEAVSHARLIKGGFPSRYGGRMSSIMDVRTRDGNMRRFAGHLNIGLLSSSALLEGPLFKDKVSFMATARRTYFDFFSDYYRGDGESRYKFYFFDVSAKLNWRISSSDRLFVSFFTGDDKLVNRYDRHDVEVRYGKGEVRKLSLDDRVSSLWGTVLASARWNHLFSSSVFSNTTAWFSRYRYRNKEDSDVGVGIENSYRNGIYSTGVKVDFSFFPFYPAVRLRSGSSVEWQTFKPYISVVAVGNESGSDRTEVSRVLELSRLEVHGYVECEFKRRVFSADFGLHLSAQLQEEGATGAVLEPRCKLDVRLLRDLRLGAGFSRMSQFLYMQKMNFVSSPADMWMPVPKGMRPQVSDQLSVEARWDVVPGLRMKVEGYYKRNGNALTYQSQSSLEMLTKGSWSRMCTEGSGYARGVEIFLHRYRGRLSGWASYSLSKSVSKFDEVNDGEAFASDNDRLHGVMVFGKFDLSEKVNMAATWSYETGSPLTLSTQKYTIYGSTEVFPMPARRNALRMPSRHQLDLGLNVKMVRGRLFRQISLGVNNVYAHENAMFVYWKSVADSDGGEGRYALKQFCLVAKPWPYVKYSVSF